MAQINVTEFAKELGLPPALLMEQLQAAGVTRVLKPDTSLNVLHGPSFGERRRPLTCGYKTVR